MEAMESGRHYDKLQDALWRGPLTPEEEAQLTAWLAANPQQRETCGEEIALTAALRGMSDVSVPSNFTSRVMHGVEREEARDARHRRHRFWRMVRVNWLPRLAFSSILVFAGLSSYRYMHQVQNTHLVRGLAAVSQVASLPSADILQDFDAIRLLDPAPGADEELLRLLE